MAIYLIDAGGAHSNSYTSLGALRAAVPRLAEGDVIQLIANGDITESSKFTFHYLEPGITLESWPENNTMPHVIFDSNVNIGAAIGVQSANVTVRGIHVTANYCECAIYTVGYRRTIENLVIDSCRFTNNCNVAFTGSYYKATLWIGYYSAAVNASITNNIFEGRGEMGIGATDSIVANNTFVWLEGLDSYSGTYMLNIGGTGLVFYNNIFYGPGSETSRAVANVQSGKILAVGDYNNYYNFGSSKAYEKLSQGANNTFVNPLFTDVDGGDYTLQSTSLCVDTGASTAFDPRIPTSDLLKSARGGGNNLWDKGAYEYSVQNYVDIITSPKVQTYENEAYQYISNADYLGDTGVNWVLSNGPTGMALDTSAGFTGIVNWTPTIGGYTTDEITLSVSDGTVSAEQKWSVNVIEVNDRPVINSAPSTYTQYGSVYVYQASASDEETLVAGLKWRIIGGPVGVSVGESTGLVTWNPPTPGVTTSPITLEVRDTGELTDIQQWTVTVLPIITGQTLVEADANSTIYIKPEMVIVSDVFNTTDSYNIEVLSGNGYRIIPTKCKSNMGRYPKIHIDKSSYPVCYVNVRVSVSTNSGIISNTYPLLINTTVKGNGKNRSQPKCFAKGKNKS